MDRAGIMTAVSYYQAGRFKDVETLCLRILGSHPGNSDAMHVLGLSLFESGRQREGETWVRRAVSYQPKSPDYSFSLGNILQAQGKLKEAKKYFRSVTTIKPDHADGHYNLGNLYMTEEEYGLAAEHLQRAVALKPDAVGAWHNLGVVMGLLGRTAAARDCYEKAIALNPNGAMSLNSMGMILNECGELESALACFKQAVGVQPNYVIAWVNLGNVYLEMSEPDSAKHAFDQALVLSPDLSEAHFNLANLYSDRGDLEKAIIGYRKALQLKSDYPAAMAQLYYRARQVCDWSLLEQWGPKLDAHTGSFLNAGRRPEEMPFTNLIRRMDPGLNLAVARAWSRDIFRRISRSAPPFSHDGKKKRKDRIVVGYLSRDFRNHPVGLLTARMFACHDRNRFRVCGYAYGPDDSSEVRKKIIDGCDRFADIGKLSTTASAKKIFDDDVDILVDLTGHTRGNRIDICALRPAPLQVSYLGFLGSSGAEFVDYILTDRMVTPPDQADVYSEKFVYLPDSFMVTDDRQPISEQLYERRNFGLPEEAFVFCSFNNAYKIDPAVFDCWMRILKRVPNSVLWLFAKNSLAAENFKRETVSRGVSPDRLVFANKMPLEEHLTRLKLADLALDTWCYNGGATTVNALWAGLPVVTLVGGHFVSRMTASCLMAAGLPELITDSSEAYESLSVYLAANPEELSRVRRKLEENRLGSALFDTNRFAVNLERAYTKMWALYLSGEKPEVIDILEK